tara:strand:- start:569 stop:751 length:183 start_codon:yes stop_codon:yes gene_type:complete
MLLLFRTNFLEKSFNQKGNKVANGISDSLGNIDREKNTKNTKKQQKNNKKKLFFKLINII